MENKFNIGELYESYKILSPCKFTKLSDDGKICLWRIMKAFKPIAEKVEDEIKLAAEKFKPYEYEKRLEDAKNYEVMREKGETELPMTEEEYETFFEDYQKYNNLVERAISEYKEEEKILDIELLSDEEFENLVSSNDFSEEEINIIKKIIKQNNI